MLDLHDLRPLDKLNMLGLFAIAIVAVVFQTRVSSWMLIAGVNILVGFAPLKPAEFVMIKLQQMAGQIEV